MSATRFVVKLDPGRWIAPRWARNPWTYMRCNATLYSSERAARRALRRVRVRSGLGFGDAMITLIPNCDLFVDPA